MLYLHCKCIRGEKLLFGKVYMHKYIQVHTCETSGSMLSSLFFNKPVMSSETLMAW